MNLRIATARNEVPFLPKPHVENAAAALLAECAETIGAIVQHPADAAGPDAGWHHAVAGRRRPGPTLSSPQANFSRLRPERGITPLAAA